MNSVDIVKFWGKLQTILLEPCAVFSSEEYEDAVIGVTKYKLAFVLLSISYSHGIPDIRQQTMTINTILCYTKSLHCAYFYFHQYDNILHFMSSHQASKWNLVFLNTIIGGQGIGQAVLRILNRRTRMMNHHLHN